jgi:hypothetical protein
MAKDTPVLIDPALGVDADALRSAWDSDPQARQLGRLEPRPTGQEFTGFVELVVVGVAVKVTADLIVEAVKRLLDAKGKDADVNKQNLPGGEEAVVVQKK